MGGAEATVISCSRNSSSVMDGYGLASATVLETMAGRPNVMATKLYVTVIEALKYP